ncbi:hypothetical protein F5141DRAFT_1065430 [Pisolithus sp. B1]|nr:hypothetical protein F5141DRAFT_1065430 [Pisolithus sp. B1]
MYDTVSGQCGAAGRYIIMVKVDQGLEDVQTISKNALFDDDGNHMDVISMRPGLAKTIGQAGDAHHLVVAGDRNTAVSMAMAVVNNHSVADDYRVAGSATVGILSSVGMVVLVTDDATVSAAEVVDHSAAGSTAVGQYEDLHHPALQDVTRDFQTQKETLNEVGTVLQRRETKLASLHDELEALITEADSYKRLKIQSQMEKTSTTWAADLEACMQEEVTRLRESLQVQDDIGTGGPSAERHMNPVEEDEPSGGSGSTVPVSAMVEVVTKGVEAALPYENEEVRLEKQSEPAIHRDFILAEVHCLFKEKLGITQDIDFITHHPATAEDVHAYKYEDGPRPDRDNLTFDLTQNYSLPWNTCILQLLCQELQARCEDKNWPVKRSDNYIMEILQECYKNAQPKLTSKGILETPMETKKYHHRIVVLKEMVKLKSEVQDNDLQSWKWLQCLVETLGEHGMSSEESSVENGVENVLRVKNMPWHRNIDWELEIVDFQCVLDIDIFSPQGSKPLTHKHSPDNPSMTHNAVRALPLALYDGAWITELTAHQFEALNIHQQTFPWMKVIVA